MTIEQSFLLDLIRASVLRNTSFVVPEYVDWAWAGLDLHEDVHEFTGKLRLAGNTLRAAWKYRAFSPISMMHALWIQAKGVLFEKNPEI